MGTRSRIAFEDQETGKVRSIYCHWDGSLEGVGKTLVKNYRTADKVNALLDLGSISSLGEELGEKHDFDDPSHPTWTLAYGRDRGETDVEASEHDDATAYFIAGKDGWEEYLYLFRQGVWLYAEPGGEAGPFLVRADDPNAEGEEIWRNVAGMLNLGEKPPSYAIG